MRELILSAKQAKAIDKLALKKFGLSTLVLMENAGRAVAQEVEKQYKRSNKLAVVCGKGNNGGDGFVALRHLLVKGIKGDLFLLGNVNDLTSESRKNLEILVKLKQKVIQIKENSILSFKKYDLIIDGLLGVGIKGIVRDSHQKVIIAINKSKAEIISIDIPSGLDATTGKMHGACVNADITVTFIAKKRGLLVADGLLHSGRIIVKDIGLPIKKSCYILNI